MSPPTLLFYYFPLVVKAILYGIYLSTSVHCFRWLVYDDEGWNIRQKIDWHIFITIILIFVSSTISLWTTCWETFDLNISELNLMATVINGPIYIITQHVIMLLVDTTLIYRCWIVYDKSWRIVCLPLLLWISCISFSVLACYFNDFGWYQQTIWQFLSLGSYFWAGFFSSSIGINVYATSAIIFRILRVASLSGASSTRLHKSWRILAESGVPYTLSSLTVLVAGTLPGNSPSLDMFAGIAGVANVMVAGIAFNLIYIRVCHNRVNGNDTHVHSQGANNQETVSTLRFNISADSTEEESHPTGMGAAEENCQAVRASE